MRTSLEIFGVALLFAAIVTCYALGVRGMTFA